MPVPLFQRNVLTAASGCPNLILVNTGVTGRRNVPDYMVRLQWLQPELCKEGINNAMRQWKQAYHPRWPNSLQDHHRSNTNSESLKIQDYSMNLSTGMSQNLG